MTKRRSSCSNFFRRLMFSPQTRNLILFISSRALSTANRRTAEVCRQHRDCTRPRHSPDSDGLLPRGHASLDRIGEGGCGPCRDSSRQRFPRASDGWLPGSLDRLIVLAEGLVAETQIVPSIGVVRLETHYLAECTNCLFVLTRE